MDEGWVITADEEDAVAEDVDVGNGECVITDVVGCVTIVEDDANVCVEDEGNGDCCIEDDRDVIIDDWEA